MTMGVKLEAAEQIAAGMSHMHSREAPTAFPPLDKALKTSREPDALLLAHDRRVSPTPGNSNTAPPTHFAGSMIVVILL